jgi:hypothetical protein
LTGDCVTNDKVCSEFGGVMSSISGADVDAVINKDQGCFQHCLALFLEEKDVVVNVIAIFKGYIAVLWLWAP